MTGNSHETNNWKDGYLYLRRDEIEGERVPVKFEFLPPLQINIDRKVSLPPAAPGLNHVRLVDSEGSHVAEVVLGDMREGQTANFPAGNFLRIKLDRD